MTYLVPLFGRFGALFLHSIWSFSRNIFLKTNPFSFNFWIISKWNLVKVLIEIDFFLWILSIFCPESCMILGTFFYVFVVNIVLFSRQIFSGWGIKWGIRWGIFLFFLFIFFGFFTVFIQFLCRLFLVLIQNFVLMRLIFWEDAE